jgi:hypothetical protein
VEEYEALGKSPVLEKLSISDLIIVIHGYQDRVAKLEDNNRWIPVSERLPEEYIPVLIHYGESEPDPGHLEEGMWFLSVWNNRDRPKGIVTHWMPFPEPLEVE